MADYQVKYLFLLYFRETLEVTLEKLKNHKNMKIKEKTTKKKNKQR